MEEPSDIRVATRHDKLNELMHTVKLTRANKLIRSGIENMNDKDWEAALAAFDEAKDIFMVLEDRVEASQMGSFKAMCLFALGRLDEAAEELRATIDIKKELKAEEGMASDLLGLGEVLLRKMDKDEAAKAFRKARTIFKKLGVVDGVLKAEDGLKRATSS